MTTEPIENTVDLIETPSPSRAKTILKNLAWTGFAILCLILFTLFKLPDDRLKSLIDSQISSALSQRGITYTASDTKLSFFLGVTYTLKNVTLNFPTPTPAGHLDKLQVSPSLIAYLLGKVGGTFKISTSHGSLDGSFSTKGSRFSASFNSKKFDLSNIALFPMMADVQGTGILDGTASVSGDFSIPNTLQGNLNIQLNKVIIDPQLIDGFSIPQVNLSEALAEVTFDKGKAILKTIRFGKQGNPADDIQGSITGDLLLGKIWDSSNLNLKARFSISENIKKSFVLLDTLLGAGKLADGSYSFSLTGPLSSPNSTPLGAG